MDIRDSQAEIGEIGNEDDTVTLLEVLEEENELEDDAAALLGPADQKNCTFDQGYLPRQPLYSCLTCTSPDSPDYKPAGVCLACSYDCHEGHELVELYTKRNFRCDCGNAKFPSNKCTHSQQKDSSNVNNRYNQNFRGTYCSCERPYPDPDDDVADEMVQCVICEDWFHLRHLGCGILPSSDEFSEMTCPGCLNLHPFLLFYAPFSANAVQSEDASTNAENGVESSNLDVISSDEGDTGPACILSLLKEKSALGKECDKPARALFWPLLWRKKLCTCQACKDLYAKEGIGFLTDMSDTVQEYVELGRTKREREGSHYEQGMKALESLGRTTQIEALTEFNELKINLLEYLEKFAKNKKVVRKEDIQEFFSDLTQRKRQKTDSVQMVHSCR